MKSFENIFGSAPTVTVEAHGRVNLIGEHTDYNGGFVLPTNIPQAVHAQFRPREDRLVRVVSTEFPSPTPKAEEGAVYEYLLGEEKAAKRWTDYVQGVTQVLARENVAIRGFEVLIHSNVPMGAGLSSSAAFEVALLRGLNQLFSLGLDGKRIARLGQKVENDFVGARCGIMDQMVASLGVPGEAIFIDTRDLTTKAVPLPTDKVELLVVNSGVSHSHANGDYNRRRQECEVACETLGVHELRDLGMKDLGRLSVLPDVLQRRARHVITENARVLEAVDALAKGDIARLGQLFIESHRSMRDDYEVSVPEIDLLVRLACEFDEVLGARLTGGGFGGSIVALVKPGMAARVGETLRRAYDAKSGKTATVLVPPPRGEAGRAVEANP